MIQLPFLNLNKLEIVRPVLVTTIGKTINKKLEKVHPNWWTSGGNNSIFSLMRMV